MDSLREIIDNLKKEEIRNFKIYTNRFQRTDEVKIASLFDLLRSGKYKDDDSKLISELFPTDPENHNAYYRLKNRLKTELEKSLLNLHHNLDERITTINLITLSSIFSYKAQYELSLYYLKKAEKIAVQNEFYDFLELIYNELIVLSDHFNEINPIEYIEKKRENAAKGAIIMQADHDTAAIRYELRKTNFGSKSASDIPITLQRIMQDLNVANEIYKLPRVKFKIHFCIRDILLQNRDFDKLETYLISSLEEFESENLFTKSNHRSKILLITWIINTLMINKKWTDAIHFIGILYDELQKFNRLYYDNFIWTYYQSLISTYMSSDNVEKAIELLEQIKELPSHKGVTFYDYGIYSNLALCYYFNQNKTAGIKTLAHLFTKEVYPKLGAESQLSISILELVLHYENKNYDYVSYRLAEIRRQFRTLLKRPEYQEEKSFFKIVNALVNSAQPLKDKVIRMQMNSFIQIASSPQVGTGKHIDYGIWVRSILEGKDYYSTMLQLLQPAKELTSAINI